MKKSEFDKLLDRYLKGRLKPAEKQKVEDWLDDLANNKSVDNLSATEQAATEQKIYKQLTEKIKKADQHQKLTLLVRLQPLLKIAACIALAGILVFGLRVKLKAFFNIGQYAVLSNANGHITKSILADGTIVWLKGNSKLRYPLQFKSTLRVVDLEGEALFEVAKDAAHPFIIHCGTLTTRVLGTSFNIKQNSAQTEVAVLTGRVFLSSKNVAAVVLQPYQKGLYVEHKKTLVKEARAAIQVAALTKGTEYNMFFNDAQLAEVIKRVEKKFEVDIDLEDQELNKRFITADFTDQSLTNTMQIISEAFNLQYKIVGQQILLNKKHR